MSDIPIAIVGGFLLWTGWIFFNTSSGYEIVDPNRQAMPQSIAAKTFASPCGAAMIYLLFEMTRY